MIVLANGCFDQLHYGHLLHLEAASRMGAILIVSITADEFVNKGPNMPAYPDYQRAALVGALCCVTRTIVVPGLIEALEQIKPHILVKGVDYAAGLDQVHVDYCKAHGIEIRFTDTPKMSAKAIYESQRR
jgi:cytidyltransferase-like protein